MSDRPFYDVGNVGNKNLSIHEMMGTERNSHAPSWSFRNSRDIYSPNGIPRDKYLKTTDEVLRGYPDPDRYFREKAEERLAMYEEDQKAREAEVDTWAIEERDFKIKTALIFIIAIVVVVGGFAVQIIW